jgi:hypothetical protein
MCGAIFSILMVRKHSTRMMEKGRRKTSFVYCFYGSCVIFQTEGLLNRRYYFNELRMTAIGIYCLTLILIKNTESVGNNEILQI